MVISVIFHFIPSPIQRMLLIQYKVTFDISNSILFWFFLGRRKHRSGAFCFAPCYFEIEMFSFAINTAFRGNTAFIFLGYCITSYPRRQHCFLSPHDAMNILSFVSQYVSIDFLCFCSSWYYSKLVDTYSPIPYTCFSLFYFLLLFFFLCLFLSQFFMTLFPSSQILCSPQSVAHHFFSPF